MKNVRMMYAGLLTHKQIAERLRVCARRDFLAVLNKPGDRILAHEALLVSLRSTCASPRAIEVGQFDVFDDFRQAQL